MSSSLPIPVLLGIYSLAIASVCYFGSSIAERISQDHRKLQLCLSFISGFLLALALLIFLPKSAEELGSLEKSAHWMLAGLLTIFFLERFFCFHHHEEKGCEKHSHDLTIGSTLVGLTVHSALEGIALAATMISHHGVGLVVLIGILFHKPFEGFTIGSLLKDNPAKASTKKLINIAFAFSAPIAAFIYYFLSNSIDVFSIGEALAFSAGVFLCISLSDLLPELHFHDHDKILMSLSLLAGIAVVFAFGLFEFGHSH